MSKLEGANNETEDYKTSRIIHAYIPSRKTSCRGVNNKIGTLNLRPPPSMAPICENEASFGKP